MKRFIQAILPFLFSVSLFAEWDPSYCLPDDDLTVLEDPLFQSVKEETVKYLKGSWCSAEKVRLIMDLLYVTQPQVCVEIGTFTGSSFLPIAITLAQLKNGVAVAIDAWSNREAIKNMDFDDPNRAWWSTVNMDDAYQTFQSRLLAKGVFAYCETFYSTSEEAALFIDEIDFLHLDGDYTEKGSLQDVRLYLPKVKPGGYILLSNLFIIVKGKAPKMRAFSELFDACEMICEIDRDNVVLFRKL